MTDKGLTAKSRKQIGTGPTTGQHDDNIVNQQGNIQYYPMGWEKASIEKDAEGHLVMEP